MSTDQIMPRNSEDLRALEHEGAAHLTAMAFGALRSGQVPPKHVLDWFAKFAVEALVATESMAQQITSDTPKEDVDFLSQQLEQAVVMVAEAYRAASSLKLFVLQELIHSRLKARALHLPIDYDTSYEGLLPKV